MSIGPIEGITWRRGFRIGSLTTYDHLIHGEYAETGSHELTTRTRIAILMKSNVHETSSLNIPPGPLRIARARPSTSARMKSRTLMRRIPPITAAASAQRGALVGFPPARTTLRSMGSSIGSILDRE